MAKEIPTDKLYEIIQSLPTNAQIAVKEFIEKILESKKAAAQEEYDLITGKK